MEATKVGIREFRDNLSSYLLESDAPVAITRHGDTIGHYIPLPRRKRTEEDRAALREASEKVREMMQSAGVTEDRMNAEVDRAFRGDKLKRRSAR